MRCAEQIVPNITEDDLLQPNDFPLLENHPHFATKRECSRDSSLLGWHSWRLKNNVPVPVPLPVPDPD